MPRAVAPSVAETVHAAPRGHEFALAAMGKGNAIVSDFQRAIPPRNGSRGNGCRANGSQSFSEPTTEVS